VGKAEAVEEDSFFRGMLDTPHYTRPAEWRGKKVPGILLSGDHGAIRSWRRQEAVRRTLERRPDLLENADIRPYLRKGVYALFNVDSDEEDMAERVLPALAEDAAAMGCKKAFLVSARGEKTARDCVNRLKERFPEALGTGFLKAAGGIEAASEWVKKREKAEPCVVPAGDFRNGAGTALRRVKREVLEKGKPVIFCFGCCGKQSPDSPKMDAEGKDEEGELSLPGSLAVTLDRFFGCSRCSIE
jgi:tRNA (guanine37-N1)-methyltransferase